MAGLNFGDRYEFDPGTDDIAAEPGSYGSPQGGLLGRLLALQAEQALYQPNPANGGQVSTAPQGPDVGQSPRTHITVRPSDAYSPYDPEPYGGQGNLPGRPQEPQSAQSQYHPIDRNDAVSPPGSSIPPAAPQFGSGLTQPAMEAAMARLVHGIGNLTRGQSTPLDIDPIDIAKSAGIGLANGSINAVGMPGSALTGFGFLPPHYLENPARRMFGYPDLAPKEEGMLEAIGPDAIRHRLENSFGEFYQPKTRAGRYAETIGEMAPMVLGGEGLAAVRALRNGPAATGAVLRELPWTLTKHAVAPGVAVRTLEEEMPDSKLGQTLQKAYPAVRRGLPVALAAKRYLSRRIVPQ
jgi:hypothetical protein